MGPADHNRLRWKRMTRFVEKGGEVVRREEVYWLTPSLPTLIWRYEEVARPLWQMERKTAPVRRGVLAWWVELFALVTVSLFLIVCWRCL